MSDEKKFDWFLETKFGKIFNGDAYQHISNLRSNSVDLIVTSPPFGLVREKEYGNVQADQYLDWFKPYAHELNRILKNSGSLVIDIGGAWNRGLPTRHLYQFKLLVMLCEEYNFHLAQDFYWWNPAKLPTPAEWVTVRRIRVKDAINKVWWLSKTPWPKASNKRVLQPYSPSMKYLLENGYNAGMRPSGHDISKTFGNNNGAAIPPNLLALANTDSNTPYLRYCREKKLSPHPARFPADLPEFFIRMLTDEGDQVLDPFAGSCMTGEVCERLRRKWVCIELRKDYVEGALGRFQSKKVEKKVAKAKGAKKKPAPKVKTAESFEADRHYYQLARPGLIWPSRTLDKLETTGGMKPPAPPKAAKKKTKKKPSKSKSKARRS